MGGSVEGLYIPRVPECFSSEFAPPAPLTQASVSPPWNQGGRGGGQFGRLERKIGTLSTLWAADKAVLNKLLQLFQKIPL